MKDRQHNDQRKRTNNDLQHITHKTKYRLKWKKRLSTCPTKNELYICFSPILFPLCCPLYNVKIEMFTRSHGVWIVDGCFHIRNRGRTWLPSSLSTAIPTNCCLLVAPASCFYQKYSCILPEVKRLSTCI